MRKLLPISLLLAALSAGCESKTPVEPGKVTITETTIPVTTTTIAQPTVASFTFSPVTPEALQTVFFNAGTSTAGSGRTIVTYSWDFGDGVMKSGVTSTHDYSPAGIYLVTLTVIDDAGQKSTASQPVTVRPATPAPAPAGP